MKFKWWFIPVALGALYILCRITFILQFYHVPTGSNEPNIDVGSYLFATNLRKPKLLDFICYHQADRDKMPGGIWVKRLCGLPGDKVQLINGMLYVNGRNVDTGLNLKLNYIIPTAELIKLGGPDFTNAHPDDIHSLDNDSTAAALETLAFRTNSIKGRLLIDSSTEGIDTVFGHPWSRDNFGPVRIPEGKYFLLGDNRDASVDSRYVGLTDTKDYIGTVFAIFK